MLKTGHKHLDLSAHINYFRDLADAFLHGRLNLLNPPATYDLVNFNQKLYLYWPPAPALVYMPLVYLFGLNLPDVLISSLFGMANVWLVMKICASLINKFSLNVSASGIAWIGIFWGLGTVHFYMSKDGSVWFVSQIMALTFLLSSILIFLTKRGLISLLTSGLLFGLAAYTRNHLVFSAFFFMFLYFALNPKEKLKTCLKNGTFFIIPFIALSILNLWYNYARFNNVFENGINYHIMHPYFLNNFNQHGYFSYHYIPYNFFVEVLHFPTLLLHSPFIKHEPEGFGFIWGSPLFLLLLPVFVIYIKSWFGKQVNNSETQLIKTGTIAATIPIALVIFSIMGTGWMQFCARYTLDFQFFLVVFLLFSWQNLIKFRYIKLITITLILVSATIQYIGAWV